MLSPLHLRVAVLTADVDTEIFTSLSDSLVESILVRIIIAYKKKYVLLPTIMPSAIGIRSAS
jgi:hypothetical protein